MQVCVHSLQEAGKPPSLKKLSKMLFPVCREKVRKKLSRTLKTDISPDDPRIDHKVKELEQEAYHRLREIITIAQEPLSLEAPLGEEESCMGDLIPAKNDEEPPVLKSELGKLFEVLTERERKIISLRFGLLDGNQRTLQEISAEFGISKEGGRDRS